MWLPRGHLRAATDRAGDVACLALSATSGVAADTIGTEARAALARGGARRAICQRGEQVGQVANVAHHWRADIARTSQIVDDRRIRKRGRHIGVRWNLSGVLTTASDKDCQNP